MGIKGKRSTAKDQLQSDFAHNMLKMWNFFSGILFLVGCFELLSAVSLERPVCIKSEYVGRRQVAETTQLREVASLSVLRTDGSSSEVTDEAVYRRVLKATKIPPSPKTSASFYEAVSEITRALYKACYGSSSGSITLGDFSDLVTKYEKAFASRDIQKLREILGYLTCLKVKSSAISDSRDKRTPSEATTIKEFFDCIDGTDLEVIFLGLSSADFSVAFVIDDTGSMSDEIEAVKCLVRSFLKSERGGPAKYILGTFNDPEADTAIFTPMSYRTDNLSDLKTFVTDLSKIHAHDGGDGPEYGVRAIKRAFDASIKKADSTNGVYSHILLFTDASAKDYEDINNVYASLPGSDVLISAFLPKDLVDSSPTTCGSHSSPTYKNCVEGSVRGYMDFVSKSDGILVNSLTCSNALDKFIQEYNNITDTALKSLSCNTGACKKKRAASLRLRIIAIFSTERFNISDIAAVIRLTVTPGSGSVPITITNPLGRVVRTQTIHDITFIHLEGSYLTPGVWTVSASKNFTLDVVIENAFDFSVDFLNETTSEPVDSLPPPGCVRSLPILVFTRQLNKLHSSRTQYINVLSSNGTLLQSTSLTRCASQINGRVLVPGVPFYLQFSGVTASGHSFTATVYNRFTPTLSTWKVTTISAPSEIPVGRTVNYVFRLTTANQWPSCSIPVNITGNTTVSGVTLSVIPSTVSLTATSPVTFRVRVSAASGASTDRGRLQLLFTGSDGRELHKNSDTVIGVGTAGCPCKNGGTCSTFRRGSRVFNRCLCRPGYFGVLCDRS